MNILHVIPSVAPLRGGPSFVVQAMARGLAARGCNVHIATTDDNGPGRLSVPLGRPVPQDGIVHWYFPRQTRFYTISWPLFTWLAQHVSDYDLVHIHAMFSFPLIPAAYWASRRGVPYVIRPFGTLNTWGIRNRRPRLKRISIQWIEGRALAGAAAVHYTTEQERIEASEVTPPHRSVVIPNPVDFPLNQRAASPDEFAARYPQLRGKRTILFLSRLDRKKGLDLLLAAFAKVRAQMPDVALLVGGAGEERFVAELRETAARLGIGSDVVWAGFLEGTHKQAVLEYADLFVLPSYSENFGVAVVEAMGTGLPVIVSDQVAIHQTISSAGAGLVVPCDANRLAESILRLQADVALRQTLAQNGRELAETFSTEAVMDQLMSFYHRVSPTPRSLVPDYAQSEWTP